MNYPSHRMAMKKLRRRERRNALAATKQTARPLDTAAVKAADKLKTTLQQYEMTTAIYQSMLAADREARKRYAGRDAAEAARIRNLPVNDCRQIFNKDYYDGVIRDEETD